MSEKKVMVLFLEISVLFLSRGPVAPFRACRERPMLKKLTANDFLASAAGCEGNMRSEFSGKFFGGVLISI